MFIPITQSKMWQKLQDDLGEKSSLEAGNGYQYLAIQKSTPVGNYLYLPYGPVVEDVAGFRNSFKSLKNLAAKTDSIFIRIEPLNAELANNFPSNTIKVKDLNPKETWLLDLRGSDEDLKAKLPSRLLRYYKNAEKNGITIETSHNPDDIHYLLDLQKALAKKKGINTFSETYLKTELAQPFSTLYIVKYKNPETNQTEIAAAGLVFDDKTTRYNLQGAQTNKGRTLHATGILTIQLIKDAKAKNLKTFDFWGIAPENAPDNHPWKGFTNFKKTFAGYERDHAGTHDIILKPLKYKLYQALRKINRKRKK
ncbi:peptidoglycan bridge formation glycyltransferase FemA/FemB family protein [Candidatus Saccharibacteria bacterium]|nr:peptidoglycan bridge formation glycyltransferase FemA/FemB family protein [Candidatus Saccharibacteria bacterium]